MRYASGVAEPRNWDKHDQSRTFIQRLSSGFFIPNKGRRRRKNTHTDTHKKPLECSLVESLCNTVASRGAAINQRGGKERKKNGHYCSVPTSVEQRHLRSPCRARSPWAMASWSTSCVLGGPRSDAAGWAERGRHGAVRRGERCLCPLSTSPVNTADSGSLFFFFFFFFFTLALLKQLLIFPPFFGKCFFFLGVFMLYEVSSFLPFKTPVTVW